MNNKKINICVDASVLEPPLTGIGYYVLETLKELSKLDNVSITLLVPRKNKILKNFKTLKENNSLIRLFVKNQLWIYFLSWRIVNKNNFDVFWGTRGYFPMFLNPSIKKILTVYDFTFLRFPKTMTWKSRYSWRILNKKAIKEADELIAISNFTKKELRFFHKKKSTELVALPGIQNSFEKFDRNNCRKFLEKFDKYVFTLGTVEPRKNIKFLINSFNKSNLSSLGYKLLICGHFGWLSKSIIQLHSKDIVFLNYVNDDEKKLLLKNAALFVYPSLYEGFGMPVVEAQKLNSRIIINNIDSLCEASDGQANVFNSEKELINYFNNINNIKLYKRKDFFTWKKTASVYRKLFLSLVK